MFGKNKETDTSKTANSPKETNDEKAPLKEGNIPPSYDGEISIPELEERVKVMEDGYNEQEERIEALEANSIVTAPTKDGKSKSLKKGRFKIKDQLYEFKALKVRLNLPKHGSLFGPTEDICKNVEACAEIVKEFPHLVEAI